VEEDNETYILFIFLIPYVIGGEGRDEREMREREKEKEEKGELGRHVECLCLAEGWFIQSETQYNVTHS
jgi:hypothetical protein